MPSPSTLDVLLDKLWKTGGTDLLITAGTQPMMRIDGALLRIEGTEPLRPADCDKIIRSLLTPEQSASFDTLKEIDFSFSWRDQSRFRANVFRQRGSAGLALRMIPFKIPSFEDLGLPEVVETLVTLPHGLILVTGPTGSGKSTTLASMIDYINSYRPCHILTIEDPIEYVHKHKVAAVNQREVGQDTNSFTTALKSALREDPDVLLIGEMRDLETIQIALTIAETGHLVFATLHTNDTSQAVDRIVDVFPGDYQTQVRVQLANSLAGIMYQQLLPRVGSGRVAAFEVMIANNAVRNLIKEGKTRQLRNVVATSQKDGMQTFETSLSKLVQEGTVTHDDAIARSLYPREVLSPVAPGPNKKGRKRISA